MKADYFSWCGWCRQSTTAPPLCPQHCGPFTAVQVVLDQSIYRPLAPLSPLSISADDEAYALDHGYASSTSPSTSLRPKYKIIAIMCQISLASPGVQLFLPGVSETVSSQLPVSCLIDVFHFPDSGLEVLISNFFILSLGRDVFGSAEPALVLYALGTEHLLILRLSLIHI